MKLRLKFVFGIFHLNLIEFELLSIEVSLKYFFSFNRANFLNN